MSTCNYCLLTTEVLQGIPSIERLQVLSPKRKVNMCYDCYCRAYVPLSDPLLKRLRTAIKAAIDEIR